MIPWESNFEHMQARVLFGMNLLELSWIEGSAMPNGLVDSIVMALELGVES